MAIATNYGDARKTETINEKKICCLRNIEEAIDLMIYIHYLGEFGFLFHKVQSCVQSIFFLPPINCVAKSIAIFIFGLYLLVAHVGCVTRLGNF